MGKVRDITGNRYGKIVVLYFTKVKNNAYWMCQCDCGIVKEILGSSLKNGDTQSCGCYRKEVVTKHGDAKDNNRSKLYSVWLGMHDRCRNQNNISYLRYGGRGISVDTCWDAYSTFRQWALINGYQTGLQIDRTDNSKGYSPSNCAWVSRDMNGRNIRAHRDSTSQYVGVSFHKKRNKWRACIKHDNKQRCIGEYSTELEAAIARDGYVIRNGLQGFTINFK